MNWHAAIQPHLENEFVILRAVTEEDRESLYQVTRDPDIWTHYLLEINTREQFDPFFDAMIADHAAKTRFVYVVVNKATGQLAGSMSYGNFAESEARLEIGWSWLGREFRGVGLNKWAKFLLLEQAFEVLYAIRVEFKTDVLNTRARAGLRNIGATPEGTLRSFNFMPRGRRRDAIFFSVLHNEWPTVRRIISGRDILLGEPS